MEDKRAKTSGGKGKAEGRRILSGIVVSDAMKDTAVVEVSRMVRHPKYRKFLHVTKRYKADDKGNAKKSGEKVLIEEIPPVSKDKRFRVV